MRGRKMRKTMGVWELREAEVPYNPRYGDQNGVIGPIHLHLRGLNDTISVT